MIHSYSKVKSLMWGIENEQNAQEQNLEQMKDDHTGLSCTSSGLHVKPKYPHHGATPDRIVIVTVVGMGSLK